MDNARIIDKDSFDRVRKTIVLSRIGDTYNLNCKLYKRGNKDVTYRRGDNFLMHGRFRYALSENAVADVERAIEPFDDRVNCILSGTAGYRVVEYDGTGITLYYKHKENDLFDSLTLYETDDENDECFGETEYILAENVSIVRIPFLSYFADHKYSDAGYRITINNSEKNVLREKCKKRLKDIYNISSVCADFPLSLIAVAYRHLQDVRMDHGEKAQLSIKVYAFTKFIMS